ncbi:MAG: Bax inhibitor-1/YccA family protein [Bacteroidetes bacterium]|nr:Bax inhibitor-1/YccA family protein [Bacteroidota bacterium]
METNNINNFNFISQEDRSSMSKTFMASVFSWMSAALIVTGIVAYYFAANDELSSLLRTINPFTGRYSHTTLGYVVMFAPLGLLIVMGVGYRKLSYPILLFLYLFFSMLVGASISYIFLAYTGQSILGIFFAASGMFGAMAILGYTTNIDLTKFGSIMMMGVVGVFFASLINFFFLESDTMGYVISTVGVLAFTGLTAWDVQKLKRIGAGLEYGTEETSKLVIWGAMDLYLDFINIFLHLLRLFGDRK